MLRKYVAMFLILGCLFTCALAEAELPEFFVPIGDFAAAEQPEAAVRGRTLIVKIPESWLKARFDDGTISDAGVWGDLTTEVPLQKLDVLFGYAHRYLGTQDLNFVADCMDGQAAPMDGFWATGYPGDSASFIMTQQYMDGAWYTITRLGADKKLPDKLYCDGRKYLFEMNDGVMRMEQTIFGCNEIDPEVLEMNDLAPVFSKDGLEVFTVFDHYLAVVTQKDTDDDALGCARVRINGENMETVTGGSGVSGYRSKAGDAVYCFFITEAELEVLKAGAGCALIYDPF